jgi:hypothetical protein
MPVAVIAPGYPALGIKRVWGIKAGDWKPLIQRHFGKIVGYMISGD